MTSNKLNQRNRKVTPLADLVENLLKIYHLEDKIKENQVIAKWQEIVGKPLSNVTAPVRVKDGILYLKVKNDVWRNELFFQKVQIIHKIENYIHKRVITDIIYI